MNKILQLALPLILVVIGVQFTRDYLGDTGQEKRKQLEELIATGKETTGTLKGEYVEKTIKIAKMPVKTYEVSYDFVANDKNYTGVKTLKMPPKESTVKVVYLDSNPEINAVNPQEELASFKKSEGDSTTLLLGLGLILVGLGLGFYRYKSLAKNK